MDKILLTDIDDVLVHFAWSFENWLKREKKFQPVQRLIEVWHIPEWLGVAQAEADRLIHEFCSKSGRYSTLPAYSDAQKILPKLYREGWKIEAITAVPDRDWVKVARKANLNAQFGEIFDEIHLAGFGHNSKQEILRSYKPTFYIEDAGHHAEAGLKAGHTVLMMDREYNKRVEDHPNLQRVKSWYDVYGIINGR